MKLKHSDGHFCEKKGGYKQLSKIMRITLK